MDIAVEEMTQVPELPLPFFVGWALLYAMFATALVGGLSYVAGRRAAGVMPTVFVIVFFVALTLHPFPDATTLALRCPLRSARPNLIPLDFVDPIARQWQRAPSLTSFLRGRALPTSMNLLLCIPIGAMLARHIVHGASVVGAGFGLSLAVELTQLTGLWGYYPCAYRKFDVDDLLLNTLGVAIGLLAARWSVRRLGQAPDEQF